MKIVVVDPLGNVVGSGWSPIAPPGMMVQVESAITTHPRTGEPVLILQELRHAPLSQLPTAVTSLLNSDF